MINSEAEFLEQLQNRTRRYAQTETGAWLQEFAWAKVPVKFSRDLPTNVMGMYNFGSIVLRDTDYIEVYIWPTYIHELRHRWQWKMHPLRYLLGKIFFLRFLIEDDAYDQEDKADAWYCQQAD